MVILLDVMAILIGLQHVRRQKDFTAWARSRSRSTRKCLGAIDEFIISVVPTLIGEGIPLIAPRYRDIPLLLKSSKRFPDGVVQLHYIVRTESK
jgi:hypothetical protein